MKKKLRLLKKRVEIIETVISQEVTKVDIRHLKHAERFEIVAMFHIENRIVFSDLEYYRMHTELNAFTGITEMEYYVKDLKQGIREKISQLLCDGLLGKEVKVYVNHPMVVKKG